jgi:hypothetical protein
MDWFDAIALHPAQIPDLEYETNVPRMEAAAMSKGPKLVELSG